MKIKKILILPVCLYLLLLNVASARWATPAEAPFEIEAQNIIYNIAEDGSCEAEHEFRAKILKEAGREIFAHYILTYNSDSEKIDKSSIEAKTTFNKQEYKVTNIEDKELASSPQGFDQIRQIMIAFPNAEVGATVSLKFKVKVFNPQVTGYFGCVKDFGGVCYQKEGMVKFNSKLPLFIQINDPTNSLEVIKEKGETSRNIIVRMKKPVCSATVNEPSSTELDPKHKTWVVVSSVKDRRDYLKKIAPDYTKVLSQPLPKVFMQIVEQVEHRSDPIDVINMVTSALAEKVTYMGDWRTIKGRIVPHDLAQIAQNQIGDCKDFSVATAAILRAIGYKAQVALIKRDKSYLVFPSDLPSGADSNHAIVKVTTPEGTILWIDPTNFVSMADGIFEDIAGRDAYVLDLEWPTIERVPPVDHNHKALKIDREIEVFGNGTISVKGEMHYMGEYGKDLTGVYLYTSAESVRDHLFYMLADTHLRPEQKKLLELPDLNSRIVRNIVCAFKYEKDNALFDTNVGFGFSLSNRILPKIIDTADDQVEDKYIGSPKTIVRRTVLKNVTVDLARSLDYEIKTPWVNVSRKVSALSEHSIEILETLQVLKTFIKSHEIKSPEYNILKNGIEKHFLNLAIVFSADIEKNDHHANDEVNNGIVVTIHKHGREEAKNIKRSKN